MEYAMNEVIAPILGYFIGFGIGYLLIIIRHRWMMNKLKQRGPNSGV